MGGHEALRRHRHKIDVSPQGDPNEGKHEPDWLPGEISCEDVLSTWKGPGLRDPGRMPTEKEIFDSKGPVEADKNDAAAIDVHNKTKKAGRTRTSQKATPPVKGPTRTWDPSTLILFCHPELLLSML